MKENHTILYAKAKNKKIIFWEIWSEYNTIIMEYGYTDGETQVDSEIVECGLALRTLNEQVLSRINSRINKKIDRGYVDSLKKAESGDRRNALGYKLAAKCTPYNGTDGLFETEGFTGIQYKLNGHHASVINDQGTLVMYSNGGKVIDTIPEILEGLDVPLGATIEGELYHHGTVLQTISSWVRKRQEDTHKLKFMIYDIDYKQNYIDRHKSLQSMKINDRCEILHTDFVIGQINLDVLMKRAIEGKFEGLVLRLGGYHHEDGARSKGLIKVKPRHFKHFRVDDEFLVVNILSSKDGWARLQCVTEEGKKFMVSCHGTIEYKTNVLENKEFYIGKHIRVEFESYTKDKKPCQPVALEWREKADE